MDTITQLTNVQMWEDALRRTDSKPLLVFKHSTSCPISAGAHEQFLHYVADTAQPPCDFAIVHVIEDRPVSNAIADSLDVQHQSPQAIYVSQGRPQWHDSHWRITYEWLSEKLGQP